MGQILAVDDWWTNSHPVELTGDSLQIITVTAVDGAGHTGWLTTSVILNNTPPEVQVTDITVSSTFAYATDTTVYYGVGGGILERHGCRRRGRLL